MTGSRVVTPNRKRPGGRRRPASREEAARLYVQGLSRKAIARRLGCAEETVSRWMAEPAVKAQVRALGAIAVEESRGILERAAVESAETLVAIQRGRISKLTKERRLAAESILDRIGVIKSEGRVHDGSVNLSTLTAEELRALGEEALRGL